MSRGVGEWACDFGWFRILWVMVLDDRGDAYGGLAYDLEAKLPSTYASCYLGPHEYFALHLGVGLLVDSSFDHIGRQ